MIPYRPEDFLVVFGQAEHRNRVSALPFLEHRGIRLYFWPWNKQAQVVHAMFGYKVHLVLEGILPHAWERNVVEQLLGSACLVDEVAPETASHADLAAFKVTAWVADPEAIPSLRWLAIPEPGVVPPFMDPMLLEYRILIHLESVTDYSAVVEPTWCPGGSRAAGRVAYQIPQAAAVEEKGR